MDGPLSPVALVGGKTESTEIPKTSFKGVVDSISQALGAGGPITLDVISKTLGAAGTMSPDNFLASPTTVSIKREYSPTKKTVANLAKENHKMRKRCKELLNLLSLMVQQLSAYEKV